MAAQANNCNHSGCYCKAYVVPTSKWSKGKCKNCNHAQKEHGDIEADVSFESNEVATAPIQPTAYSAQIDGKMGIVPSGSTNYKDVGGYGNQQKKAPSIYSVQLDESDWINWSADDLLIWLQQQKRFPEEIDLKSIEHEMQTKRIDGSKLTQLSHSTLLSYGFTDYNHRGKLLDAIKKLLEQHPSATQTPTIKANVNKKNNANQKQNAEEKQEESLQEADLLKQANLDESKYKTWNTDQVWSWVCIKQGWANRQDLEYLFIHKLNEFEEKLKSDEIKLTGSKFKAVVDDIKTQTLLKGIGFTFTQRKAVYASIAELVKKYP